MFCQHQPRGGERSKACALSAAKVNHGETGAAGGAKRPIGCTSPTTSISGFRSGTSVNDARGNIPRMPQSVVVCSRPSAVQSGLFAL
jgi:hypothetical protein